METNQMATERRTHGNGSHKSHNGHKSRDDEMSKSNTSTRGRRGTAISTEWLRNFLSEMLAVEKGGVKLYERALSDLEHSELEDKLSEFLRQTHRHVELCTSMLEAVGADPDFQSPGAQAAEHKANGLITAEVPPEMQDLNNIENLVLAETKDHWNWEMLASIAPKIEDPELKRAAMKAISEVRRQEKMHVDWNEKTLSKLAMESAMHGPAGEMSESEADDRDEEMYSKDD
jgi:ferritin-like metal-binding protein YciE